MSARVMLVLCLAGCAVGTQRRGFEDETQDAATAPLEADASADARDGAPSHVGVPACDTSSPANRDRYAASYRTAVAEKRVVPCTSCGATQCCYELVACVDL